jgi:hypothetical protein
MVMACGVDAVMRLEGYVSSGGSGCANAVVNIDAIDAGGRLAQPHLSGIRIADADLFA